MTEERWLKCSNIWELTEYLHKHGSERRLRLFSHACCQRLRPLGFEELFERGLAAVEARAEGACSVEELSDLHTQLRERLDEIEAALRDADGMLHTNWHSCLAAAVMFAVQPMYARRELNAGVTSTMGSLAFNAQGAVANPVWERTRSRTETDLVNDAESLQQVALVRDIFGNPFQPVTFEPSWRTTAVDGLATGIYEEKAFDRLPVLADALEDAGCSDGDILDHCRSQGEHVRGCWVVDLILGKS